jgi:hypothetical protein
MKSSDSLFFVGGMLMIAVTHNLAPSLNIFALAVGAGLMAIVYTAFLSRRSK